MRNKQRFFFSIFIFKILGGDSIAKIGGCINVRGFRDTLKFITSVTVSSGLVDRIDLTPEDLYSSVMRWGIQRYKAKPPIWGKRFM